MSRISDVSSKLGQYMLAGWVLTDLGCTACSIPMLRSPAGQSPERMFCVQCQASPDAPLSVSGKEAIHRQLPPPSIASTSSTGFSRVSTPPTEVSSTLSSPTFAPPPDPQETLRRRAQSDLASAEIGRRMLRGWAMMAEECLNDSCYGVPLVRPPKPGGGRDPRKECVVCGNVYIFEKDSYGLDRLVPVDSAGTSAPQLREASISRPEPTSASDMHTTIPQSNSRNANKHESIVPSNMPESTTSTVHSVTSIIHTLNASVTSLDQALIVLSHRMTALSRKEPVDHISMGEVALSMEKVTNALRAAKHLCYQENNLHAS